MKCPNCGEEIKKGTRDSDEVWRSRLGEAFPGVDIEGEMAKMRRWLILHPGRNMTRRFVENWLSKADRAVSAAETWQGITVGDPEAERRELDALRSRKKA